MNNFKNLIPDNAKELLSNNPIIDEIKKVDSIEDLEKLIDKLPDEVKNNEKVKALLTTKRAELSGALNVLLKFKGGK